MRNLSAAFVVCFVCFAQTANAECKAIDSDLDRLACYDRKSGRTPQTVAEQAPVGDWLVESEKSEFKDTTDVYLSVDSEDEVDCGVIRSKEKISLHLRCQENSTSVFIATHCHLASGLTGYGKVEYRVDEEKSGQVSMDASTNNKALGLWQGKESIPFIRKLFDREKLLIRFTPFSESPVTAEFNIAGLSQAIVPLKEACSW